MQKYDTRYFGEIIGINNSGSINMKSKINLNGKVKDVSLSLLDSYIYPDKINECIKKLDEYPKLNKIGNNKKL